LRMAQDMTRTTFGMGAEEFARAIENGPPYLVRYQWAGGGDRREREAVTRALGACFGVSDLESVQTIVSPMESPDPLAHRVKYVFWLLRVFGLSLGFTHGWEERTGDGTHALPVSRRQYRITMRVDRSRYREDYEG
jgi:hypothetical protein